MKYSQKYLDEIRAKIPEIAYKMFAERGIGSVSVQNIADEVGLGFTTMYRYYGKKSALVIGIAAAKWAEYYVHVEKLYAEADGNRFTAREELEFYLDCYIELYKNHKDLLIFNRNFDIYVMEEKPAAEEMKPYYDSANIFRKKFHNLYEKGKVDKTIRTDISEDEMFFGTLYSMLAAAAKYACGLIYPPDTNADYSFELEMLKRAYMRYLTE